MIDQLIAYKIVDCDEFSDQEIAAITTPNLRNYWLAIVNAPISGYNLTREQRLNVQSHMYQRKLESSYSITLREAWASSQVVANLKDESVLSKFIEDYKDVPFRGNGY